MPRIYWLSSAALFVVIALLYARTRFGAEEKGAGNAMPSAASDEEEQALYFRPAGRYSPDDIEANGHTTPSRKFRGFRARHDFNPRHGDPICPITRTKADAACHWIIGGRKYAFCCPPCVDEFVRLAKERPDQIELPEAYSQ